MEQTNAEQLEDENKCSPVHMITTSKSSSSGKQRWISAGSGLQLKLVNGSIGWTLIPYNSVKEWDTKRKKNWLIPSSAK
jgi:hypothetical protein